MMAKLGAMTELSDLEDDGPSPQVADATPKAKSASRSSDDKCADAKAKAKSKDKAKGSGTKSMKKSRDMKSTKPKKSLPEAVPLLVLSLVLMKVLPIQLLSQSQRKLARNRL